MTRNKDIHLVHKVVEISFRISRSVDSTVISIRPLWEWFTKIRIKHCQKMTQIITSLHVCEHVMEATGMVIRGCDIREREREECHE